jgi:acylphosphatase
VVTGGRAADQDGSDAGEDERVTVWVSGRVQGVGFRWWTRARALELGLVGWAANLEDGRVEVVAEGQRAALDALVELLGPEGEGEGAPSRGRPPRPGTVSGSVPLWGRAKGLSGGFVER